MNPWLNPLQVARMYKFLGRNWNIIQFYSKFSWKINGKQWRGKRYPNSKALHIPWKQEYLHPRLKISTNTSTLKRKISKEIVVGMMQIVDDIENKHLLFVWREPSNLQKHAQKKNGDCFTQSGRKWSLCYCRRTPRWFVFMLLLNQVLYRLKMNPWLIRWKIEIGFYGVGYMAKWKWYMARWNFHHYSFLSFFLFFTPRLALFLIIGVLFSFFH